MPQFAVWICVNLDWPDPSRASPRNREISEPGLSFLYIFALGNVLNGLPMTLGTSWLGIWWILNILPFKNHPGKFPEICIYIYTYIYMIIHIWLYMYMSFNNARQGHPPIIHLQTCKFRSKSPKLVNISIQPSPSRITNQYPTMWGTLAKLVYNSNSDAYIFHII